MNIKQKIAFVKHIFDPSGPYLDFFRQSWALTWPMLVIMAFDLFMNITNTIIAGHLGKEVQAATGLAIQSYFIFTVVITALTIGTIAVISRIFGSAERDTQLQGAVFTAVVFSTVVSAVIALAAFISAPIIINSIDAAPEVKEIAVKLVRIYCGGLFFQLMVAHFNGILRACKMIQLSMKVMVLASATNIILCLSLVFLTQIGYVGIALSTALAWVLAFILISGAILKIMGKGKKEFSTDVLRRIIKISWPSGVVSFSWQFSSLALYTIIAALPVNSVETMAAMTAGLRIESIIFMPAFAFNMTNAVLAGNLLGEGKKEDAFTVGLITTAISIALISLLTVVVIIFAPSIANIIGSKDAQGVIDPIVTREIITYLHIVMLSEPFVAAHLAFGGALAGAGDTKSIMKYTLVSLWVVRIPIAYIFGITLGLGAVAVWWAMNFTFLCQTTLSARRYFSKKWL